MEWIGILIGEILLLMIVAGLFKTSTKKMKEMIKNERLDQIAKKFPNNKEICQRILEMLHNETVSIKENENKENKTSLYIAITDTIWIANIKNSYTRIQTIAHECLHSIQGRKRLLFNFIYSNVYLLYFLFSIILTIIGIFKNYNLQLIILIGLSFLYYMVRSYLEIDAMTKAKFIAKDYMQAYIKENNQITQKEVEEFVQTYEKINEKGIPMTMFVLFFNCMLKIAIYTLVAMTMTFFFV